MIHTSILAFHISRTIEEYKKSHILTAVHHSHMRWDTCTMTGMYLVMQKKFEVWSNFLNNMYLLFFQICKSIHTLYFMIMMGQQLQIFIPILLQSYPTSPLQG